MFRERQRVPELLNIKTMDKIEQIAYLLLQSKVTFTYNGRSIIVPSFGNTCGYIITYHSDNGKLIIVDDNDNIITIDEFKNILTNN